MDRRTYGQLTQPEKAVIRAALNREEFTRDEILAELEEEDLTKTAIKDAFSSLLDEQRLFRIGNRAEHTMVERDLF